jgi:DNA-binding GntR family transcriptional regulator
MLQLRTGCGGIDGVRQAHLAIRRAIVDGDPDAAEAAIAGQLREVGISVAARLAAAGQSVS